MIKVSNVKVMADRNGSIVIQNQEKPQYGSIAFEQMLFVNNKGFWNKKHRVAFTAGRMDELQLLVESLKLQEGSEMPGHLYLIEQFTPFYEGQQPKCNPSTGNAVLVDGCLVYTKTFYDESGTVPDVYLNGIITAGDRIMEPKEQVVISTSAETSSI